MNRFVSLFALFMCPIAAAADDPPVPWQYTVMHNGKPAVGAKAIVVELTIQGVDDIVPGPTATTTADANGNVQIARAKNSTSQYARVLVRDADGRCGFGTASSQGEPYPKTIDLKDTTTLSGRIVDNAGQPIPDLHLKVVALGAETIKAFRDRPLVYADTPDAFWDGFPIYINGDGSFRVPGVMVQQSVAVQFTSPAVGTGRFWVDGKPAEIRLEKTGAIQVSFDVPPEAKPAPQRVVAKRKPNPTNNYLEATAEATSNDGNPVTIANLPPGTYDLSLPYPGVNDHYPAAIAAIDVKPDVTANATSLFQRAAHVTAKFIDNKTSKSVAGAVLKVMTVDGANSDQSLIETKADADGHVDVRIPAGLISVAPQAIDGYAVVKFSRNQFREYATDPVPIAAGAKHDFGQFALAPTIDIAGTVVDEAGQEVAGAHIMVGFSNQNFYRGPKILSDAAGRFVIRGMNPDGGVFGVTAAKEQQRTGPPVAVDPAALAGELHLVVSEKFAAHVRARAVDRKGQPIAGATIELSDSLRYLSSTSAVVGGGTARKVGETKADGVYSSEALQAGNKTYGIAFNAPGYRPEKSSDWEAKPGETKDFGDIVLTRCNSVVKGIVTDRAGKPIVGATVFSNADGPRATKTITDATGQFALGGLFEGPAIVSAKADGFVLASRPAEADGPAVTCALRRSTDAPDPPPRISDEYGAASEKLARHLVEAMWANRVAAKDDGAATLRAMARIDPDQARRWRDEEKARSQADLTKELDAVERECTIDAIARRDPDEAVALLTRITGIDGFRAVCALCDKLCIDAPLAAQRLAEEAVARARGLPGESRGWALAQAGEMVYRSGRRDAGQKIIEEAAANVEDLDTKDLAGYRRGMIAARLAYFDPVRARKLIDPMPGANEFNRWLGAACVRLSMADLPLTKKWLRDFRPGNSFDPHQTRQHIAYRLAKTNPDEAIAMIDSIENSTCRAIGYADLAQRLTDPARGIHLIDQAVDQIVEDPSGKFASSGNGGAAAALLLYYGKKIGHPDLAGLRDRVLAARTPRSDHVFRQFLDPDVKFAEALALTDPATARLILDKALPPEERIKVDLPQLRDVLVAVSLVDPAAATHLVDRALEDAIRTQNGYNRFNLSGLARMLTHPNGKFGEVGRTFVGFFEEE